jgi:hypothetical protein
VSLADTNDVVGLYRVGDQADHRGQDFSLAPDFLRERRLIPGSKRNTGVWHVSTLGAIHQIDAQRLHLARKLGRLFDIPTAFHPVGS